MRWTLPAALLSLASLVGSAAAHAQIASPPLILGAMAGPGSTPVQPDLAFYGTDLGWTVQHEGELQILFGDTNDTYDHVCYGQTFNDDTQGTIPLQRPASGVPPLTMATSPDDPNGLDFLRVVRDDESLQMGYGQVPVSAYSDGRNLVAIVGRGGTIRCQEGVSDPVAACRGPVDPHPAAASKQGQDGLTCTQQLGECTPAPNDIATACDLATGAGCNAALGEVCTPTPAGLCIDPTSSQNIDPAHPDPQTAANEMEFAIQDRNDRELYESVATLRTNKFINPASRTVKSFKGSPTGNDYRPGNGAVFVWGRPGFRAERGKQAQLYLLAHPLPIPTTRDGQWHFHPWYYAGVHAPTGAPKWSRHQRDAKPLPLDGNVDGSPFEEQPLVNQLSVSWVGGTINKWVMLYAGNIGDYLLADPANARPGEGPGSIRIRFADHPWGPWSPAQPHLLEGSAAEVGSPLGPGGVLFNPKCVDQPGATCADSDEVRPIDFFFNCFPFGKNFDQGFFYAANIIDSYTESDGQGGMNLYWNVSTWNPYSVLFVKTNLQPGP